MLVTNLMIGDWVQVPSELNRYKRIRSTFDMDSAILYEPIPLTTEMLEKNGFVYDSEDKLFEDIYPRISMLYAQHRLVENGGINYGEMSEIKYVHQLQHALRLCGIDKEIDLNNTEN